MANLITKKIKKIFNGISLGDSTLLSRNSIVIGDNSLIFNNSNNSIVIGNNSQINNNTSNSTILGGSDNIINSNILNSTIIGGNNVLIGEPIPYEYTGTTLGISLSGITVLGVSDYTATTSNTVYVPNLQFTSSASTINGISIQSFTAATVGGNLWMSGSGVNCIIANNGTGNIAQGQINFVAGENNRIINNLSISNSSILGGINNTITD